MLARAGGAAASRALAAAVAVPLLRQFSSRTLPRLSLAAVEKLFREMEGRCVQDMACKGCRGAADCEAADSRPAVQGRNPEQSGQPGA